MLIRRYSISIQLKTHICTISLYYRRFLLLHRVLDRILQTIKKIFFTLAHSRSQSLFFKKISSTCITFGSSEFTRLKRCFAARLPLQHIEMLIYIGQRFPLYFSYLKLIFLILSQNILLDILIHRFDNLFELYILQVQL